MRHTVPLTRSAGHLAHSARADLLRRLGGVAEARAAYERALELARRLSELPPPT